MLALETVNNRQERLQSRLHIFYNQNLKFFIFVLFTFSFAPYSCYLYVYDYALQQTIKDKVVKKLQYKLIISK